VQASGSIGDGRRHETEVQDEPVLGAKHLIAHEGSGVPQASRGTRSCVSVLSSRPSNRSGVIAFLTPFIVIGYRHTAGHQRLTTGQPSFGADNMNAEPTARPMDLTTSRQKEGTVHRRSTPSQVLPKRGTPMEIMVEVRWKGICRNKENGVR